MSYKEGGKRLRAQYKSNGYALRGDGRVLHRAVWMRYFGPIPPGFHVHHVDQIKTNNAIGNLVALPAWFHEEIHRQMRENYEMRKRYTKEYLQTQYELFIAIENKYERLKHELEGQKEREHGKAGKKQKNPTMPALYRVHPRVFTTPSPTEPKPKTVLRKKSL